MRKLINIQKNSFSSLAKKILMGFRTLGIWFGLVKISLLDEMKFIRRQKLVLMILVAIPVFYPFVISYLYSADQAVERPSVVIDEDNSALSRKFTMDLEATQEVRIDTRTDSFEDGWEALKRRQAELLVYIPPDFSRRIKKGEQGAIRLWINSVNMTTYAMSYPAVHRVAFAMNEEISKDFFHSQGMGSTMAANRIMPVTQETRNLFHPSLSYGAFLIPGIFIIILQQLILISLSFSAGLRRELGEYDEKSSFPLAYLTGKFMAHGVFYVLGIAFMLFAVFPLFGWPNVSAVSMFVLFLAFMLAMAPIAAMVAHFSKDRYASFQVLMLVSTPLFMFSGFLMPPEQMPKYLQMFSWVFPATPALFAVRILSMKTGSLSYVAPYFLWLLGLFLMYLAMAAVLVRKFTPKEPSRE